MEHYDELQELLGKTKKVTITASGMEQEVPVVSPDARAICLALLHHAEWAGRYEGMRDPSE